MITFLNSRYLVSFLVVIIVCGIYSQIKTFEFYSVVCGEDILWYLNIGIVTVLDDAVLVKLVDWSSFCEQRT